MKLARRSRKSAPDRFLNREISWLEFNGRVLEEARDASRPLLDRLHFACIAASNLDEFFMVRVAALQNQKDEDPSEADPAGLTAGQQLSCIAERAHGLVTALYAVLRDEILPPLAERGVRFLDPAASRSPQESAILERIFSQQILPALTPLAIDASRPFPMLSNLSVNLALLLAPAEGEDKPRLAVVQLPVRSRRLIPLPGIEGAGWIWLEDLIRIHLPALFPGQAIMETTVFRITRDAELEFDEEGGRPYVESLEEDLRKRRRSRAVRMEIQEGTGEWLLEILCGLLYTGEDEVYHVPGPVDPRALAALLEVPALGDLMAPAHRPRPVAPEIEGSLFSILTERDILLHHPYDSFEPVVRFIAQAADDPDVLAIKLTLYRTSAESPILAALGRAADNGKQVTVVVELRARFDEASNIRWARRLEEAGAHVIYGIRGYKTHAKICLIVRREAGGIRRYVHLGTGNYNDRTARLYTDVGLLTADRALGEDASAFFNALTGYSDPPRMRKLVMAPTSLRQRFVDLIGREQRRAEAGQRAEIRAKVNSLQDEEIIRALYVAAGAGVRIRLVVRGVCCLRPGVKGVSETIEVISILDRFLEHSRVFWFMNGGDEEVYLSSADWMTRNLDRRIELLFPVEAPELAQRLSRALDVLLADNVQARRLLPDGSYLRLKPGRGEQPRRAQDVLVQPAHAPAAAASPAAAAAPLEPIRTPPEAD